MKKLILIAGITLSSMSAFAFFGPNCDRLVPAIEQTGEYHPSRNRTFSYFDEAHEAIDSCEYNAPAGKSFSGVNVAYACGMKLFVCNFEQNRADR